MRFNEIYLELYPKYAPKFERKGLDFDKHFGYAFNNSYANGENDFKEQIIKTLEDILAAYVSSEPKTRAGGFWRKVGKVVRYVLPFVKHIKIGKK